MGDNNELKSVLYRRCITVQESSIDNLKNLFNQFEKVLQNSKDIDNIKTKLTYTERIVNSMKGIVGLMKNNAKLEKFKFVDNIKSKIISKKKNDVSNHEEDTKIIEGYNIEEKILHSLCCIKEINIKLGQVLDKDMEELERSNYNIEKSRDILDKNIKNIDDLLQ